MSCHLQRLPQLKNPLKCLSKSLATPQLLLPPMRNLTTKEPPPSQSPQTTRDTGIAAAAATAEWRTIYRLPLMRLVAGLNRLKVHQAILTAISTPAAFAVEQAAQCPPNVGVVVAAVGVSGLLTLSIVSLATRNLVGFVYVNKETDTLKLAYVDYWGRRQHAIVAVDDLEPLWDQARPGRFNFFQTIRLRSDAKLRFKLLQRFGVVVEPTTFSGLFGE